jgi:hypothetical protein
MKTSKIILFIIASIIIISFTVFAVIMRNTIQSARSKARLKYNITAVSVGSFENLDFSSHVIARINQGKECKIEIVTEKNSVLQPKYENINGTLHCMIDSVSDKNDTATLQFKITMPEITEIRASRDVKIYLTSFQSDSIRVILGDGCAFEGKSNTLRHISFITSGHVRIGITHIIIGD